MAGSPLVAPDGIAIFFAHLDRWLFLSQILLALVMVLLTICIGIARGWFPAPLALRRVVRGLQAAGQSVRPPVEPPDDALLGEAAAIARVRGTEIPADALASAAALRRWLEQAAPPDAAGSRDGPATPPPRP